MSGRKPYDCNYRVAMVGDRGVGKTELLKTLTNYALSGEIPPTAGLDLVDYYVQVDQAVVRLEFRDMGCSQGLDSLPAGYFEGARAVVFVYDVTDFDSLKALPDWLKVAKSSCTGPNVQYMVIGNKIDIIDQRSFEFADPILFASNNNATIFKTSAVNETNVKEAFEDLAQKIYLRDHPDVTLAKPESDDKDETDEKKEPPKSESSCIIL